MKQQFDLLFRCIWCNRLKWPWQKLSPGASMHERCHAYVTQIAKENQAQYLGGHEGMQVFKKSQAELRWEEEDRL